MKRPRPALLIALAVTGAASAAALFGNGRTEDVTPVVRAAGTRPLGAASAAGPAAISAGDLSLLLSGRPGPPTLPRDLFAAYSWLPPPPPPPKPAPPPPPAPPQAPPLGASFAGVVQIDGQPVFLLVEGERTYGVRIGGQIESFRLQSATPRELQFVHLPTGLPQRLPIGGAPLSLVQ